MLTQTTQTTPGGAAWRVEREKRADLSVAAAAQAKEGGMRRNAFFSSSLAQRRRLRRDVNGIADALDALAAQGATAITTERDALSISGTAPGSLVPDVSRSGTYFLDGGAGALRIVLPRGARDGVLLRFVRVDASQESVVLEMGLGAETVDAVGNFIAELTFGSRGAGTSLVWSDAQHLWLPVNGGVNGLLA